MRRKIEKYKKLIGEIDESMKKVFLTTKEKEMIKDGLKQKGFPYLKIVRKLSRQERLWEEINNINYLIKHLKKLNRIRGERKEAMEGLVNLSKIIPVPIGIPKIITDYQENKK